MRAQEIMVRDFLFVFLSAFVALSYGKSCGNPGDLANGEVTFNDTNLGSIAHYACHIGYNMISKRPYRECQADGTWSNVVPECQVQSCEPPYPVTDGSFQPDHEDYSYQDAVTYRCNDKKFALIGDASLVCTSYGNWSSKAPKCIAVECQSPNVHNPEKLSGFTSPYYFNSAISFKCKTDFLMTGSNIVKCNIDSQWDPPLPTCNPLNPQDYDPGSVGECQSPNVSNAEKLYGFTGPYYVNSTITFKCNSGFLMNGSNSVKCNVGSQWIPPLPTCYQNNVAAVRGNAILLFTMALMGNVIISGI